MSNEVFNTVNPATGEMIETFHTYTPAETETILSRSEAAFKSFRKTSTYHRADLLLRLAQALRQNKESLAKTITTEMGKIFSEAQTEVERPDPFG